ncbi:MAG: sigma 54-interacting transcriptional regulator [Deltaproteobacteria bacterium]|nr:sigma 54-interacting transcriptional regulator [Deltaproteobacteria bacterium]
MIDVRFVAASNKDLKELISRGEFREDLFYRLNVFPIKLPSLKEMCSLIPFSRSNLSSKPISR